MKKRVVVIAIVHVIEKIIDGDRRIGRIEINIDISLIRV